MDQGRDSTKTWSAIMSALIFVVSTRERNISTRAIDFIYFSTSFEFP